MGRKRTIAEQHNELGRTLNAEGLLQEAIAEYRRASEIDPAWSVPHYNLGLVHKYGGDWELSLLENRRAVELDAGDSAGWWNLGIAATATGSWQEARRAWKACGMDIPPGDGPVDYHCGLTPIRLDPSGEPEVVWAARIDPARAIVRSIPTGSHHRFEDLVLHDGAPTGYRKLGEREVPVFNSLGLLQASRFSTFVAEVEMPHPAAIETLTGMAAASGLAAEDWSSSIRRLCKACSEGRPHEHHEYLQPEISAVHRVAVAAPGWAEADRLLAGWRESLPSVQILSLELHLDAAAG